MSYHFFSVLSFVPVWLLMGGVLTGPVLAQGPAGAASTTQPAATGVVRKISIDDAVRLALEQNLDIQVDRLNPQISDLDIAQARAAWTPEVSATLATIGSDSPVNSFLVAAEGGATKTTDRRFSTGLGYSQLFPWGGNASLAWDSLRSTSNSLFTNFNPTLRSNLAFDYTQPLLRNREIDSARQQLLVTRKNREISDVQFRDTVVNTTRNVKNAYWDLAYARASLNVSQQTLDLARQSLRNTRSRVEIGTMAPIDIVEADAEVADREEAVIVAEAAIGQAEDRLKSLVLDPTTPDFWNIRFELVDVNPYQVQAIDLDAAVRTALDKRTDLAQARKTLESSDINIRYARNQILPDVNLQVNYGLAGLGGTEFLRGPGFPGPVVSEINRSFGSVLGDLFANNFPNWTVSLTVGYPIGVATAEANLARARLQYSQSQVQIKNMELQVVTQVRDVARQVNTNAKRMDTTRVSRQLNERRLEAEEKKFTAGTSTSFFVFQAQRDLAEARNNELRALLDYNKSLVDFETVQESAIGGGGGTITVAGSGVIPGGGAVRTTATQAVQGQFGGF
ncbi:MAG: TolC family protein [Vicinamibacterales bacterium]